MPKDLLLEIGTEELPARFINPALEQLGSIALERLTQTGLKPQDISVYGTPRRLAFLAADIPEKSPDLAEIILGPMAKDAKEPSGAWKPSVLGFAKSHNLHPEQLKILASPREKDWGSSA